jgi:hypothetical protein
MAKPSKSMPLLANPGHVIAVNFQQPRPNRQRADRATRLARMTDSSTGQDACYIFTGSVFQASGYGQIADTSPKTGKPTMRCAHVVAWEVANGRPVPSNKHVLHARGCDQRCV